MLRKYNTGSSQLQRRRDTYQLKWVGQPSREFCQWVGLSTVFMRSRSRHGPASIYDRCLHASRIHVTPVWRRHLRKYKDFRRGQPTLSYSASGAHPLTGRLEVMGHDTSGSMRHYWNCCAGCLVNTDE